jgi:uncharacterized protein YqhQ
MSRKVTGDELAVGGQAVMEGVMMRSTSKYAVAVRDPKNKIKYLTGKIEKKKGFPLFLRKIPFVRGSFVLVDAVRYGYKGLNFSANVALEEEEEEGIGAWIIIVFSILLAILLFKFLPFGVASLILNSGQRSFVVLEALIKLLVFIAYVLLISLSKDVSRVFEFHGAEHKTIHCYEKFGMKKLTSSAAMKCSRIHPRCGTTFLFLVIIISMVVYAFVPSMNFWLLFVSRLALLPVIAGISFEVLRLMPKLSKWNPLKWILYLVELPGIWMQHITTKEPSKDQIEVAIAALKKIL